ncbi:acyl-CoA/acyl-ACP dehydrogenase [Streptomyces sp. ASQP_92]|uniref:acyl-CoA dehydrogenase family protein n=1 Tax=Streptomyces sp. ASQP_92 TaxID=2979116 RepID=UPI0021C0DAFC|nr:acyl-CoA dehydrogenase family protein [Streptomyces sp. ASQP_92]MCT9089637.1 acyl-CoA/acyl-ACP dehydrogenase [Streptomyces sp. ASQP_92]
MTQLDDRLLVLRGQIREWGAQVRPLALEIDRDPEAIRHHFDLPAVRHLATMGVPEEYGHEPEKIGGHRFFGVSALERAVVMEELACADVGTLVASPGPLLAGVAVGLCADDRQKRWFYGRMLAEPLWTCFALTEPEGGSDAAALRTSLTPAPDGSALLSGEKRYVGNACRAQIGVVFARARPGPLGITAVLVDTAGPGFDARPLDMIGLRGARISSIVMDRVPIPEDRVLGRHLTATRRGVWAFVQTFNVLRPGVAAIAVGIARAALEYVAEHRSTLSGAERERFEELGRRVDATRHLVHHAAAAVDARGTDGHLASAAKLRAARLAEDVTLAAATFFGPGARLSHPFLDKLARDARAMEFLEGTGNMQRLNLFQGLLGGKVDRDRRRHPAEA